MRSLGIPLLLLTACASTPKPAAPPPPAKPAGSGAGSEDLVSALAPLMPKGAMDHFDWSPEAAAQPSEKTFANVKVLGHMRSDRFMEGMMATRASLGVECDGCHMPKAYPSDEKPEKRMARRMLLMTRDLNDHTFKGETRVTCWTCHRAEAKPPSAPEGFAEKIAAAPPHPALAVPAGMEGKRARDVFKNLQVLGGRMAPTLRGAMTAFTITLGVECSYCHDDKDWASDAKPAKQRTREMIQMVGRANAFIDGGVGGKSDATCWTCHRGNADVPRLPAP